MFNNLKIAMKLIIEHTKIVTIRQYYFITVEIDQYSAGFEATKF